MDTDRLAKLMRMVLGAATEGEQLAALAAFHRAMEAEGLDLHDVAESFAVGRAPPPSPADDDGSRARGHDAFEAAVEIARNQPDNLWPDLAAWLVAEDDAWHARHGLWLLAGKQRSYAERMVEEAQIVRPSLRQAAWLVILAGKVSALSARPDPPPRLAIGVPAPARPRPERQVPPSRRHKPQPRRIIGRQDQMAWIAAIVAARRLGARPAEDVDTSALFSDAEARALVWVGAKFEAWTIDRSDRGKDDLAIERPHSAAEIAAGAQISLRTARRALAKARAAGYLAVERPGIGRGRRTVYRLVLPPDRLRHDRLPTGQPRRQKARHRRGSTMPSDPGSPFPP